MAKVIQKINGNLSRYWRSEGGQKTNSLTEILTSYDPELPMTVHVLSEPKPIGSESNDNGTTAYIRIMQETRACVEKEYFLVEEFHPKGSTKESSVFQASKYIENVVKALKGL